MRRSMLFAVLGLLVAGSSFAAAPPCWPISSAAKVLSVSTFPTDREEWLTTPADKASFMVTYWCAGKYGYSPVIITGFRAEMVPDVSGLLKLFAMGSEEAKTQAWNSADKCLPDGTADPCAKYAILQKAGQQQLDWALPNLPQILWKVAPNGKYPDRPAYLVVNGKRSKNTWPTRTKVGAVCRCSQLAIEEGSSSYCPAVGGPENTVTLCALAK